jgi:hypothetical protein
MNECNERGKNYNNCISVANGCEFLDPAKCAAANFDPKECV